MHGIIHQIKLQNPMPEISLQRIKDKYKHICYSLLHDEVCRLAPRRPLRLILICRVLRVK